MADKDLACQALNYILDPSIKLHFEKIEMKQLFFPFELIIS
jgi:hypothetical protein